MVSQRLSITLPEDVVMMINSKPNKSGFIADAVREKMINDKRRKTRLAASRLSKYYSVDKNLHTFEELETEDFLE